MSSQFMVSLSDKQRHLMNRELIIEHVDYLRSLSLSGKLAYCGPCKDGTALMILNASTAEEAEQIVDADPFSQVNYYATTKIVEIQPANLENNFHLNQVLTYLDNLA